MDYPENRRYTATHEWVETDGTTATVGLTDFAQSELGEIVFVNLPEVGDEAIGNEAFADVESVKAVSEVISPVDGTICEANEEVLDDPGLINRDPFGTWLIRVDDARTTADTMDAAAYQKHCLA